ncbi:hypothetical protein MtrunA17_Chr6g0471701 [Medicago truncatula]|nr:uncharacterized protein LOC25497070 [Medicago truncatula]XP_039682604.1 uncharacterized protein LOC25497070 [Medicago truncatula]RHN51697.1 hypothetical protein MtrunA17_Chr6g0471701 [Medicago truncatula]
MYKRFMEKEHSLMVQEGIYREVSEMLKFPPPETESEGAAAKPPVKRNDMVALASGGYAEVLSFQEDRQHEGVEMKKLSDSLWKNKRMSLDDFLGNTEASIGTVVDARICRLL